MLFLYIWLRTAKRFLAVEQSNVLRFKNESDKVEKKDPFQWEDHANRNAFCDVFACAGTYFAFYFFFYYRYCTYIYKKVVHQNIKIYHFSSTDSQAKLEAISAQCRTRIPSDKVIVSFSEQSTDDEESKKKENPTGKVVYFYRYFFQGKILLSSPYNYFVIFRISLVVFVVVDPQR